MGVVVVVAAAAAVVAVAVAVAVAVEAVAVTEEAAVVATAAAAIVATMAATVAMAVPTVVRATPDRSRPQDAAAPMMNPGTTMAFIGPVKSATITAFMPMASLGMTVVSMPSPVMTKGADPC